MITAIALMFFATVATYFVVTPRVRWLLNPVPVFVLGQTMMFAGSLALLEKDRPADIVHAVVMYLALVAFIGGAWFCDRRMPIRGVAEWRALDTRVEESGTMSLVVGFVLAASLGATFAYYRAVGANVFVDSALSYLRFGYGLENAVALREKFYAGEKYVAPGYANQFKNILLPLLTLYFAFRYRLRPRRRDLVLTILLLPITIVALLGTGQRGPLVDFVLMAALYGLAILPAKASRRFLFALAFSGLALFGLATFFLNRGARVITGEAQKGSIGAVALETWERVTWGNQAASVVGFRYVVTRPSAWGTDWFASVASIVPRTLFPNKPTSTLSLEIFEQLFYSRAGTAPASIWGSAWYNFGPFGLLVVAWLLGMAYQRVYAMLIGGPKLLGRVGVYAALSTVLGLWQVGGPETLLNRGLLALIALAFLFRLRLYVRRPIEASATASLATPAPG